MQTKMLPSVRMGGVVGMLVVSACVSLFGQTSVLTQHNDLSRTGQNLAETILTPANVSSGNFGKLFTLPVDGQVLAQPLYVPNLTIGSSTHNVLFVATEHDSVYAFDADKGGAPLWQITLLDAAHGATTGATTDPISDTGCDDVIKEVGITSTPTIDPTSGTIYVEGETFENNYPVQRLHALSITTGAEKFGGPVVIKASMPGTGTGSSNGVMTFDPKWENQRAAVTLVNGQVYLAFGSHCDGSSFHGWLMAYNATTLAQSSVWLASPDGEGSGIWMSGAGPAVDTVGGVSRMFLATGNGSYNATIPYAANTMNYGDDIVRLSLTNGISISDVFTPMDQAYREANDQDVGSGGVMLLPDQPGPYPHLLVQTGKGNSLFLLNRDNLGGYSTTANNIVQEVFGNDGGTNLWGAPAYWNGNIYVRGDAQSLKQFSITNGVLSSTPIASASPGMASTGSIPSVSANGNTNGIVWVVDWTDPTEVVYAYDATNVAKTLWSSAMNPTRDTAGPSVRYTPPTIVNGKVYIAFASGVAVYGIIPPPDFSLSMSQSALSVVQAASATDTISVLPLNGFTGSVTLSATGLPSGVTASFAAGSSGSSVATFQASPSAATGAYAVTITGVSGAISHSSVLNLTVTPSPNFTLSANPEAVVVQQGGSVTSTMSIAPLYGFTGAPTFSVSGLPSGVTGTFSPTSSSTSSTITLKASTTAWVGSFTATVTGASGSLSHVATLKLTVTRGLSLTNVQFVNKNSGRCVDVSGMSTAPGTEMGQWDCWGGANQLWNLTAVTGGMYRATSINSGLTLDIAGSSAAAGALAVQDAYASLSSQNWSIKATSDGYFTIVNGKSGMCLDVLNSYTGDGSYIDQSVCSGIASQEWSFIPLSADTSVNLASAYNLNAIGTDGLPSKNGGADGEGNQFPVATLGSGLSFYGYNFAFGPANVADGVATKTVALPYGQYEGLYILDFAVNGSQPNQTFKVTYSDGTTTTIQQGVSDWGVPQNYAGEYTVFTSPYRLLPSGAQDDRPFNLYGFGIPLDGTRTPVSVTLPPTLDVVVVSMTIGN